MKPELLYPIMALAIAAGLDLKSRKIPNWLTLSTLCFGLVFHGFVSGWSGLGLSVAGCLTGFTIMFIPFALGVMGAGDVKLLAAIGAWVGALGTIHAFVWTALFGGVLGVGMMFFMGQLRESTTKMYLILTMSSPNNLSENASFNNQSKIVLPYAIPIALGFYAYFLLGGLVG